MHFQKVDRPLIPNTFTIFGKKIFSVAIQSNIRNMGVEGLRKNEMLGDDDDEVVDESTKR